MSLGKNLTYSNVHGTGETFMIDEISGNKTLRSFTGIQGRKNIKQKSLPMFSQRKNVETRNRCLIDLETLVSENLVLKSKLTDIETENIILKKKIFELDQATVTKEKFQENYLFPVKSSKHVPSLKIAFKECRNRLKLKESLSEELKAKMRTKRAMNAEEEIQRSTAECIRLKNMLMNALKIVQNSNQALNNDERLANLNEELDKLKSINHQYQIALEEIQNEIFTQKNHERFLEKTKKKKIQERNAQRAEYKRVKIELSEKCREYEIQCLEIQTQEKELQENFRNLVGVLDENQKKYAELDGQLKKRTEENEKTKNLNTSYKNALRKARTMNIIEEETPSKLKNPPEFFKRIHKIIKEKNMMIEVFLSLFDKFNKRILTVEELFKVFESKIKGMKKKYIENALLIMGINEKYICLDTIEDWYSKFDYEENTEKELHEHIRQNDHKRNTLIAPKIPELTPHRKIKTQLNNHILSKLSQNFEDMKIGEDLSKILLDISLKMEKKKLPKEKITEILLGRDFNESLPIFSEDLEFRLATSPLDLNDPIKNKLLAKFLCEPEQDPDSTQEKNQKFSPISKKLKKYCPDWEVYNDSQRLRIKLIIYKMIRKFSHQIMKSCREKVGKDSKKISFPEFRKIIILHGVNFQEEIWRFWFLKFYPDEEVDFKLELRKFKTAFPAEDSINLIKEKKKYRNLHLTDLFNIDLNGLITVAEFAKNVKRLYLGLHSKDVLELICYIQERFKSFTNESFTTSNLLEIFN